MLISVIEWRAYDLSFYDSTYDELGIAEYIGMSKEDLMETTTVLLSYMQRQRGDMVVEATINGKRREVFNEREKLHMLDVNALIKTVDYFTYVSYAMFGILIGYVIWKKRKEEWRVVSKAGLVALGVFSCVIAGIVGFILVDFDAFWTFFHEVFFTNDLWLLNPYTDVMIQMFPLEFFNKIVVQIAIGYIGFLAIFLAVCLLGTRSKEKNLA